VLKVTSQAATPGEGAESAVYGYPVVVVMGRAVDCGWFRRR